MHTNMRKLEISGLVPLHNTKGFGFAQQDSPDCGSSVNQQRFTPKPSANSRMNEHRASLLHQSTVRALVDPVLVRGVWHLDPLLATKLNKGISPVLTTVVATDARNPVSELRLRDGCKLFKTSVHSSFVAIGYAFTKRLQSSMKLTKYFAPS